MFMKERDEAYLKCCIIMLGEIAMHRLRGVCNDTPEWTTLAISCHCEEAIADEAISEVRARRLNGDCRAPFHTAHDDTMGTAFTGAVRLQRYTSFDTIIWM